MLRRVLVLPLAAALSGAGPARARPEPTELLIRGVSVIDATGAPPRPGVSVLVRGGRIVEIGAGVVAARDARVLDGTGRYLIPGLFDMHAHVTFLAHPGEADPGYDRATSERVLRVLLAMGVTTVRNPAAPAREGVQLREDVKASRIPGPRIFTAGESLSWLPLRSESDVREAVRKQAETGVDFVKVYAGTPPAHVQAAIAEAHARRLKVIGHLQTTSWKQAAALGIDFITHGASWSPDVLAKPKRETYRRAIASRGFMRARIDWLEALDLDGGELRETVAGLVGHGVWLDPTLVAYETKFRRNSPRYRSNPLEWLTPAPMLASWHGNGGPNGWTSSDFARALVVWPKLIQLVKLYHDSGVKLLAGSDLPNPWVVPGASLHQELELLASAGIPPLDVLKLATRNGAEALGLLDELGTLEVGKRADMVLLSANPAADIGATRRIEAVIQNGRVVDREALLR
jgi:imidazolonepropionase-like amidohydrolase